MVVLTIVTQKNGETIFFDEPIPEVNFMKLISCSLYNSWDTLKREGSAVLGNEKKDTSVSVGRIPTGHYNLESMAEGIKHIFERYNYSLATKTNTVQPKNNARARTSFCVRKKKFFLRLIAGHLSLSSGNRKNFFAVA